MAGFVSHPFGVYPQGVLTPFKPPINTDDGARPKVRLVGFKLEIRE